MSTLRAFREELGLRQADLGSQHEISMIETGKKMPGLRLRRSITARLNAAGAKLTVPDVLKLCRAHQPAAKPRRRLLVRA